jgi:hypothetical protein
MAVEAPAVEALAVAPAVGATAVEAITVKAVEAAVKTHARYKAGVLTTSQDNDEDNKDQNTHDIAFLGGILPYDSQR